MHAAARTAERHRDLVRRRFGVVLDPAGARKVAAEAIRGAAHARNHPPDLINIALERLVEGCFELPAFSTLDKMASRIRSEVNAAIFGGIAGRAGPARLEALLDPAGPAGKTGFDRLKRSAPRPSWTNFRRQLDHLRWADDLGDAAGWVEGVAASKLADFAGEADAADAAVMRDYGEAKKIAFRADLQGRLSAQCADCDGGYPDNADLVIDDRGVPSLKRYRAAPPTPTALALEAAIAERMPERMLLGIVARTGHWLEWWRRFGPASGSDPKLADAFFRYTLTTFTYGSNLGPAQAARHMAGVSAHELGVTARRHATIGKLNLAIADVVDAFSELDLVRARGDGGRRRHPGGDVHRQPAG